MSKPSAGDIGGSAGFGLAAGGMSVSYFRPRGVLLGSVGATGLLAHGIDGFTTNLVANGQEVEPVELLGGVLSKVVAS